MSVEALAVVLNHSKARGTDKLVLLGIANHDGDGGAYPSIETLGRYANCSRTRVKQALRTLVELGEIVVYERAGGTVQTRPDRRTNRYAIKVGCPETCDRSTQHKMLWLENEHDTSDGQTGARRESDSQPEPTVTFFSYDGHFSTERQSDGVTMNHPIRTNLVEPISSPTTFVAEEGEQITAQTVVALYVDDYTDAYHEKPPARNLGRIAREARLLIDEGKRIDLILEAASKCVLEGHANLSSSYSWLLARPNREKSRSKESATSSYMRAAQRLSETDLPELTQ